MEERQCIHKEKHSPDHGDVVFPRYYPSAKSSWCAGHRYFRSPKGLRDRYFLEIRNILNGYSDRREDSREIFLDYFYAIRRGSAGDIASVPFEWLNIGKVRKVIKTWKGDPLDVLYYLNRNRLVESAVLSRRKELLRK
jgi:hypothetical protein